MIDYKDCDGVDRGVARLSVRRRILIMAFSLVTFSMALFWLHLAPEASGPELPDIDIELGRPGVKFPVEDEWAPPEDWDPVNAVYYEFQR